MELIDAGGPDPGAPREIGRYEIVKPLAAGGMAEVFLARTSGMLGFQKLVVIKRILPHLANRADFIQMFLDEARITTQLQHPNIVQTFEVGVANRSYFIAMEYLHGQTVRAVMNAMVARKQRLPTEHAVQIVSTVASALHYAHERVDTDGRPLAIVHRDVTPQNIIVTYDGTVKLLDFGIAKAQNRMGETRAGTLKGKLPYMSPEQCRGEVMDHRSDIFALGIMLYEMTLTRRLFRGVSDFDILKQIVEGEITPPRQLDPSYPPALEDIVMHALRKPREDRYQSAREMLVDLHAFARSERLAISTVVLGDFVRSLFGERPPGVGADGDTDIADVPSCDADASMQIEMTPGERRQADAGPDIPPTEPFKLEFTSAAPNAEPILAALPSPTHAPRRGRRVLALAALVAVGVGAGLWVNHLREVRMEGAVSAPVATAQPGEAPNVAMQAANGEPPAPAASATPNAAEPPKSDAVAVPPSTAPIDDRSTAASKGGHAEHHHAASHSHPHVKSPIIAPTPVKVEGVGTLVLATTPWCEVSIDKAPRGTTPLTTSLPAGPHTLTLKNDEFGVRRTVTVTIEPNRTLRKRLDFDTPE